MWNDASKGEGRPAVVRADVEMLVRKGHSPSRNRRSNFSGSSGESNPYQQFQGSSSNKVRLPRVVDSQREKPGADSDERRETLQWLERVSSLALSAVVVSPGTSEGHVQCTSG